MFKNQIKDFYNYYSFNHYLYKITLLENIYNNYDEKKNDIFLEVPNYDKTELFRTITLEIRATVFQAIETLFELIFAIQRNKQKGQIEDLWYLLSNSPWQQNYDEIVKIAQGENPSLSELVLLENGLQISLIHLAFYYGLPFEYKKEIIQGSCKTINNILLLLASEFKNRNEYNSLKHCIRCMPLLKKMDFLDKDKNIIATFDFSNTYSFMVPGNQKKTISLNTKKFETNRDILLVHLSSYLITNIILSRRFFLNKSKGNLTYFTEAIFKELESVGKDFINHIYTVETI